MLCTAYYLSTKYDQTYLCPFYLLFIDFSVTSFSGRPFWVACQSGEGDETAANKPYQRQRQSIMRTNNTTTTTSTPTMILQQHHLTTTSRTVPLVPAPLMPGRKRVVTFGSVTEIMEDSCCNWRKNDGPSSSATPNDHSVLPRVPDSPTRGNNPLCIQRHHHEAPAHRFVNMDNSEASMELAHLWGSNSSMDNPVTEQDSLRKKRGGRRRRNHVSGQQQQQPPEEPEGALSSSSRHRNTNHPESPTAQSPTERRNARNTSGILPEVLHNHQHYPVLHHPQNTSQLPSIRTTTNNNNTNNTHGNSMNSSIHWDSWQAEWNDDHEGGGFHNSSSSQNDHNDNNNTNDKSLQFSNVFFDGSSENLLLGSFWIRATIRPRSRYHLRPSLWILLRCRPTRDAN